MEYRRLGRTDLRVSAICLGTMTWGQQNSEAEGHAQMDHALDRGINFWDAAEMYPVPPTEATYGRTETIIGSWFASRGGRDKVILATKVAGPDPRFAFLRGGDLRHDRANLRAALEGSLKRLKTDYVDLYQLHWPERRVNSFGRLAYDGDPAKDGTPLAETLAALGELVAEGKIRHIGLSNDTPWGLMRLLQLADAGVGPRIVSIQNPYNLLNRSFEMALAEVALHEDCGLLAYSPLAMGLLTGKYQDGTAGPNARLNAFPNSSAIPATMPRPRPPPMSRWRASMASTPGRWRWPSSTGAPSSPATSSAPPAWSSWCRTSPAWRSRSTRR